MIPARFRIHRVKLHPLRELPVGLSFESKRVVLRLTVADARGKPYADVSPLPGLHAESLEECLETAIQYFTGQGPKLPPSLDTALGFLNEPPLSDTCGSQRAVFENSALVSLDRPVPIPIHARVCKLKIGHASLAEAAKLMQALLIERSDREFRLDCNQALQSGSVAEVKALIAKFPVSYIEEPFSSLAALKEIARHLPIALDENLGKDSELDALAKAWIIKPNVLGFALTKARLLDRSPILKVLSNAFESDASLQLYSYYYKRWVSQPQALGFGTAFYFPAAVCDWNPRIYHGPWPLVPFSKAAFEGELVWEN